MRNLIITFSLIAGFTACKKDDETSRVKPGLIADQLFNSTLFIDGHNYDETIIRNCIFENINGDGLQIRDVNNLRIENCIFRNISENAIRFRNSGSSNGVQILGNTIHDIEKNGILAPENHINTLIKENTIYNVATNHSSSQFGAPHHGIYFQGRKVIITQNHIHDVMNEGGNCVSIRTNGVISRNKLSGAADHGISYFSDHPGSSGELLIENNVVFDNGKRGINLASNGNAANHIEKVCVRFNTIISSAHAPVGINDDLTGVSLELPANILIRTDGGSTFIYSAIAYDQSHNVCGDGDIGFVDFANRDLHPGNFSSALNAALGIDQFPETDLDGKLRDSGFLDSGAYEN